MPRLGCSSHTAYVQTKCNGSRLCDLLNADRIYYERRLDDISEAEVHIPISGDVDEACCSCLADVEPWCHVLTIVREGDGVVWTGPIQEVIYSYDRVIIKAKDKLAWLQVRVNEATLDYPGNTTISLTDMAEDIIALAMGDDGDTPCFLDCVVNLGDGFPPGTPRGRTFPAFGGPTAYDDLQTLAESGIDFTVFKHCLILGAEQLPVAPIGTFTDEMIIGDSSGIEVRKDGYLQGNRFWVRYDADTDPPCNPPGADPCPAFREGDQECYGLVERILDNLGLPDMASAGETAQSYLDEGRLTPRVIEFPPGTQLSPEVPWVLNDMIPGQRVDVALSKLCVPVFQSFRLLKMAVDDGPENEKISIDLGSALLGGGLI